jgi:hypothetical protein
LDALVVSAAVSGGAQAARGFEPGFAVAAGVDAGRFEFAMEVFVVVVTVVIVVVGVVVVDGGEVDRGLAVATRRA